MAKKMGSEREGAAIQMEEYKKKHPKPGKILLDSGAPVDNLDFVLTAGRGGPIVLQDYTFLEEVSRFNRERIPERVVHAKGAGAFGYFEVTEDIISIYTKACIFAEIGKRTKVAVRFSTVSGERGSADAVRATRGFAIKFYTEDGIWDLVGQNFPVFLMRDPMLFPSFMRIQKRNPVTYLPDGDGVSDMLILRPETLFHTMCLFSDRGLSTSYRNMHGYGVHAFKLVNNHGVAVYCKFHLKSKQGIKNLGIEEAEIKRGKNPNSHISDLYNAIYRGDYPSWIFYVQIMTIEQVHKFKWNPFDETKLWPEKEYPLIEVGKLVLNKNPSNYFTDVEQIAFSPSHLIPGIEPSPSKLLQGRMFAYPNAQMYRLGTNHMQIPINCPFKNCNIKIRNYHRDGAHCMYNQKEAPIYYPNSYGGPVPVLDSKIATYSVSGDVDRYDTSQHDDFDQPRIFYNEILSDEERKTLAESLGKVLPSVGDDRRNKVIELFSKVSPELAENIRNIMEGKINVKRCKL